MPPEFDPDSLKRNYGASFNCICRLPSVRSCPKSVLGSKCFQEMVGYLQRWCFHVGFLEFQSHSKHKCHFDVCLTNFSRKNSSDLIVRFYVDFDKNVKWYLQVSYVRKASIRSCEAFVRIVSNGKALLIDPDNSYLIRKGFIRLVT